MPDAIVRGIVGQRGYGKTTRAVELTHADPHLIAWDPLVSRGRPRGQFSLPHRFYSGEECAEWIRARRGRIMRCAVHSFSAGFDGDERDDWAPIVQAIADTGGRCTVAIDEASTLCRNAQPHPALAWLLAYGRHIDVGIIWTARRPAEVARLCTGQAEIFEAFRVTDHADLDALRGPFGARVRELPTLSKFEFLTTEDG